ncbi:MAG: hypothetical protein HZC45_04270 [Deltaproteobacteria bacterium]|nr:hypothetical protein [Deltaproteobacteria bacterium]
MKNEHILSLLEETAERFGVKLRYEDLKKGEVDTQGGSFVLKGERYIFIHKNLPLLEKVRVLEEELAKLDFSDVYIIPEVRDRLEKIKTTI